MTGPGARAAGSRYDWHVCAAAADGCGLMQGHGLMNAKPGWRNPVRWREIYGNFSTLAPGVPPLWGTVKDSVDSLLAAGIQPLGENNPQRWLLR